VFVTSAVSNLGGWTFLRDKHPDLLEDINSLAAELVFEPYDPRVLFKQVASLLSARGWSTEPDVLVAGRPRPSGVDGIKDGVGIDVLGFVAVPFLDRKLFVRYPFLVRALGLECVVAVVPDSSVGGKSRGHRASPASVRATFTELAPLTLKYRFVVLGLSSQPAPLAVTEVSTELDSYLIGELGGSLAELTALGEQANYDFKVVPQDQEDTGKTACGFANIPGGGALLVGVANDGSVVGVETAKADQYELAIIQAIRDTCSPPPPLDVRQFPLPDDPARCLLIVRVGELLEKPCVHHDVVRIRVGASTRAARPDEIRRMVLGASPS
jgi:hypothetical protein